MRKNKFRFSNQLVAVAIVGVLLVLGACSKSPSYTTTPTTKTSSVPTITITSPTSPIPTPGSVTVMVQITNFDVVDKQGQSSAPHEGYLHFYLDVDAPTTQGQPAIPTSGVWAYVAATNYTFANVTIGTHTISIELVNNDHTPLNPPVVQKISVKVTAATTTTTLTPTPTTTPATPTTPVGGTPGAINLVAQNMAFNYSTITVQAGATVTINFNNKDNVPHNFALYSSSSATPPAIFQGQLITGTTITYTFTAPTAPGTYFFRCDVHPTIMTGNFIVTAVSSSSGGDGY